MLNFANARPDCVVIFSSHCWDHGHHRNGLHGLLEPWRKDIDFVDLSVPEAHPIHTTDPALLEHALRARIIRAHALLALAGMYASHSYWMKREIDIAREYRKFIIPIIPNGQERVSKIATDFGSCDSVHWRSESVKRALLASLKSDHRARFLAGVSATAQEVNQMQGFYSVTYAGPTGAAALGLVLKAGRVYGVDAAGGDISGTYVVRGDGGVDMNLQFIFPAGAVLVTGQVVQQTTPVAANITVAAATLAGGQQPVAFPFGTVMIRARKVLQL